MIFVWFCQLHHEVIAPIVVVADSEDEAWVELYKENKLLWWELNECLLLPDVMEAQMKERIEKVHKREPIGELKSHAELLFEDLQKENKTHIAKAQKPQVWVKKVVTYSDRWNW